MEWNLNPKAIPHVGKQLQSKRCSAQAVLLGLKQLIPSHFTLAQVLEKFLHGLSFPTYQRNTLVVVKKKPGGQQSGYSSLLFCFAFGCRNRVTVRSCLSRLPGFRFLSICGPWTMFSLGLQSCQCTLPLFPHCVSICHCWCTLSVASTLSKPNGRKLSFFWHDATFISTWKSINELWVSEIIYKIYVNW